MAHPLRGECEAQLNGKAYKLKLEWEDFEELDQATQSGPMEMLQALHPLKARLPLVCTVLQRAVRGEDGKRLAPSAIKAIVSNAGFAESVKAATEILMICLRNPSKPGNADEPAETAATGE